MVGVDQAGHNEHSPRIDHLVCVGRHVCRCADSPDNVVFDPFISPYETVRVTDEVQAREKAVTLFSFPETEPVSIQQAVEDLERTMVARALTHSRYNQRKAAEYLGLSYDQLRGKIRKYGQSVLGRFEGTD